MVKGGEMAEDTQVDQDELQRYRQAAEDALQQLDWCIGYLHGIRKVAISRALARNRSYIREQLLHRDAQPVPTAEPETHEE
jgi:hypothetical protein